MHISVVNGIFVFWKIVCPNMLLYLHVLHKAVELTPPYKYKEKPYQGILPDINEDVRGDVPDKVDKFPRIGQIPKLPPLPSIAEQEGGT